MVKADYNRDYYADLDLPQNADINEIKRQFRKLALKYHPDRNPGREAEVNSKFQTIQTAHEILASPESKAKYDNNRARSGRFPMSSGVKGNPWQDVGKDFPPPPRRNDQRSNPSGHGSASAARYARFPMDTPPPPPPRPADRDEAQSNADAFERMRSRSRRTAPTAPQPNSSASASRPKPAPDPRQTAYTASQKQKAEASFGNRTPRSSRSGFAPGSPMGDEAPVTSKHYATKRHTSLFEEPASAYQKPQASGSSSDRDDGGPRPFLGAKSSPYGGVGGEKLDPFSGVPDLGRARSTREIPRKPVGGDPTPFGATHRQRSFSVSDDPESPTRGADGRRGGEATTGRAYHANTSARMPSSPTPSRFGERYTPKPGSMGGDDASSSGASAAANVGAGKTNGGQPNVYDVSDPSLGSSAFPFEAQTQPRRRVFSAATASGDRRHNPCGKKERCGAGAVGPDSSKRPSSGSPSEKPFWQQHATLNSFERMQYELLHDIIGRAPEMQQQQQNRRQQDQRLPDMSRTKDNSKTNNVEATSYPQPPHRSAESLAPNANEGRFMRNSADNINTRFVAEEHANTNWEFNAGNERPDGENGMGTRRTQSQSGNRGRRSPPKRQGSRTAGGVAGMAAAAAAAAAVGMAAEAFMSSGATTPNEPTDPQQQQQQQQKDINGFDADQWREKIGSEHFVPVPPPRGATSPNRNGRSSKRRPKANSMKSGSAGLVDDDETTSGEDKNAGVPINGSGADSDNAMDIDTPMGDAAPPPPPPPPPATVRGVPLEPSRPEWRAGDANGFAATSPGTGASPTPGIGLGLNLGGGPSSVPPLPPKIPVNDKPRFNTSNAAGSEDTDDLGANFADFKNVEPLVQPATGLGSFEDLKTTLPFESQAAPTPPLERPHQSKPYKVNFPKAPLPPRPPAAFGIPSMTPNKPAWDKYVAEFEVYLREWDNTNAKFVDHVIARQSNMKKVKQRGWSAVTSDDGIQEYFAWLEEDKQVHEKWTAYTNEHRRRVREFMAHKDKMNASL